MKSATRPYTLGARAEAMAATRARILDAARRGLIRSRAISLDTVADLAGVSRPTIYRHFGSRAALIRALLAEVSDHAGLRPAVDKALQDADPIRGATQFVDAATRLWEREIDLLRAILVIADDPELAPDLDALDLARRRDAKEIARRLTPARRAQRLELGLTFLSAPQTYVYLVDRLHMSPGQARSLLRDLAAATASTSDRSA